MQTEIYPDICKINNNLLLFKKLELTSQEILLLKSLDDFYKNEEYFNLLSSIIEGTNNISRRTFEYFVTNYSMRHNISYELVEKGIKFNFIVHSSYKDQLRAHRKRYFDPFGRGDRIPFFSNNNCIITTIGQLNFYRWFFIKKIYNYCNDNYKKIQKELFMNKNIKIKKNKNKEKKIFHTIKKQINYVKVDYSSTNKCDIMVSFDI
jgi:hypothetical protein